jgi:hypothetical protein
MFFGSLFLLFGLAAAQQTPFTPCVPAPVTAAFLSAAAHGPVSKQQQLTDTSRFCCQLSSGVVSCATTDDNDGVVIDLDLRTVGALPGTVATDSGQSKTAPALFPKSADAVPTGAGAVQKGATTNSADRANPATTVASDWTTRLVLTQPGKRFEFTDAASGMTGKMWYIDYGVGDQRTRIVTSRTLLAGVLEQRVAALYGFASATAGPEKCRDVCGTTTQGRFHCMPMQICIARLHAPQTYYLSAKWGKETVFAATVVSLPEYEHGSLFVETHFLGAHVVFQSFIVLAANPELNRFAVTAKYNQAALGPVSFTMDSFTFDDPGTWGEAENQ